MLRRWIIPALVVSFFAAVGLADDQGQPARPVAAGGQVDDAVRSLAHSSVTLPLEDLRELLTRNAAERTPVDFAFSPAAYEATATDKSLTASASVEVSLLVDSWVLVPIGPSNSGITSATADGQTVPLVLRDDQLYLLLKGKGSKKLAFSLSRDPVAEAGNIRLDIPLLPSALVNVSVKLPAKCTNVRAVGAAGVSVAQNADGNVVKGSFHGGMLATIHWRPAAPPGVAVEARTDVDVATLVSIDRSVLRTRSDLRIQVVHRSVKEIKIDLDPSLSVLSVDGPDIADWAQAPPGADHKTIVVRFTNDIEADRQIGIAAERDLPDPAKEKAVDFRPPSLEGATRERGFIGVEVRDNLEVTPSAPAGGVKRVDVKDLPETIGGWAKSPVLLGYRYDAPGAKLSLALTRNADLDVLVAMSDICEASTTYTPDGKSITKMMFVTRNNLKQFMTLKMPEGAQLWSAFVADHPVTPAKNAAGDVLVPLRKSEPEDADDDAEDGKSYRAQRERRRIEGVEGRQVDRVKRIKELKSPPGDEGAPDLKPYDVEIVFVMPPVKLAERGQVRPALPQSDIPIGQLSWAVFLPANLKVVDADGNVKEVSRFTLPFRHFGDVAYDRGQKEVMQEQATAQRALEQLSQADQARQISARAKAQGVLPVRIEIPMVGQIHRFEKFLTVEEAPSVTLTYGRKIE